ncbi:MAG: 50S ribosomal protein L21e [Candidatus Micrarchaeota archaeon]
MKRSHGKYSGRGRNLTRKARVSPARRLASFAAGERVRIDVNPSFKHGMPHLRFNHKMAKVIRTQGNGILVKVYDGNKEKTLAVANVHLARG